MVCRAAELLRRARRQQTAARLRLLRERARPAIGGLEQALHQRMERIDELIATIDKLREQNKRLDQEAEHLAQMVAAPLVDADAR